MYFSLWIILLLEPRNKFAVGDNIKRLFFYLCVTQLIVVFSFFFCLFDVAEEGEGIHGGCKVVGAKKKREKEM